MKTITRWFGVTVRLTALLALVTGLSSVMCRAALVGPTGYLTRWMSIVLAIVSESKRACRPYWVSLISVLVAWLAGLQTAPAATNLVTSPIAADTTWTAANEYQLGNLVYVLPGATLTIAPGTVIKGRLGQGGVNSGLIITRGARIFAQGTREQPIIFTSQLDDVSNPDDLDIFQRGLWGGVIIMGYARINTAADVPGNASNPKYEVFEGLPDLQISGAFVNRFGGTNDNDDSGVLRYVSIRHAGITLLPNKEINSLSLCAVGRGTTIEYVETYAGGDDGFEFFGGTVNTKYLVSAFNDDDAFDTDQGYSGKNQFWFAIQEPGRKDNGGELNGEPNGLAGAMPVAPFANFTIYNGTWIGAGTNTTANRALQIREYAAPRFYNSILTQFGGPAVRVDAKSYFFLTNGTLDIRDNLWWNFAANGVAVALVDPTSAPGTDVLFTDPSRNNVVADPQLTSISRTNVHLLDPRPRAGSPALAPVTLPPNDGFFTPANYKGAFDSSNLWLRGWTFLDQKGFLPTNNPPVSCVPPPSGLVSWWPGDGTANDIVGNNHGTLQGGATFAPGLVGQAFGFNGGPAQVLVPDSASLNITGPLTLETWIRMDLLDSPKIVVWKGNSGGADASSPYALSVATDNRIYGIVGSGVSSTIVYSTGSLLSGVWYHVGLVAEGQGASLKLYLNGALNNSATQTVTPAGSAYPFRIGGGISAAFTFNGLIDEVSLYNRALSPGEIGSIHSLGAAGKCKTSIIVCSSNKTVECGSAWTFDSPAGTGACSGTNVTIMVLSTVTNGLCPKIITRAWKATDLCGNTNYCSQTVSVVNTNPPTFIDRPVSMNLGCNPVSIPDCSPNVRAIDNCESTTTLPSLLVSIVNRAKVKRYNGTSGAFIDTFASPDGPTGLVFGPDGNLYVNDGGFNGIATVKRYNGTTGALIGTFVTGGSGGLANPLGLRFGPDGNLYVSSADTSEVKRYNGTTGAFIGNFVTAASGGLSRPDGLVFGPDGNLYVSSFYSSEVKRYNGTTGAFINNFVTSASGGLNRPTGLVFGPDGNLYVSSSNSDEVKRYNGTTGVLIDTFASGGGLSFPFGLEFGPDGNLFVISEGTAEVKRYHGTTGAFIDNFVPTDNSGAALIYLVFTPPAQAQVTCAKVDTTNGCQRTRTITYTAVDNCHNSNTCTQVITWTQNTTTPTFNCYNLNVACGDIWSNTPPPASSLCCSNVAVRLLSSITNGFSCFDGQFITNTWQATDCCSNTAICVQTVIVHPEPPPIYVSAGTPVLTLTWPTNLVLTWPCVTIHWSLNGLNIPGATNVFLNITNVNPINAGLYNVTASGCGFLSLNFRVALAGQLVMSCPPDKTVLCGSAWSFDAPHVTSGVCSNATVTLTSTTLTNLVNSCKLVNTRTWFASDSCGHSDTCSQVVTIANPPPTLFCPTAIASYTCSNSVPVFYTATASNICTVSAPNTCPTCPKVLVSCFPASGSLFGLGTNTVTCFATDYCGATNSCAFEVVVLPDSGCCQPPAIAMQPRTVVTAPGGTAVFNATATGSPTLSYQWRKDGTDLTDGGNISGAHTPTLMVASVLTNHAGGYSVAVSNFCGTSTSLVAQLVLSEDYLPDVALAVRAPNAVIVSSNATFTFTVSNEGAVPLQNLTFSGTFTEVPATLIQASPGCLVTPSGSDFTLNCPLPLLPVGTSVVYRVTFRVDQPGTLVFSGSINAVSDEIILANNAAGASTGFGFPPVIVTDPVGFNGSPGDTGSLSVSATGTAPLGYFWRLDNVQLDAISDTLNFALLHASAEGAYDVMVSNAWGTAVSAPAVVILTFPGVVTAGIDGMQVLQVVGKTATTDMEIRLKAGDATKLVVDDLGGSGVVGEFDISSFSKLVIDLGNADNKLVFNDANGIIAALDKQFEIHGGTGSNVVVASSQDIDLTAFPSLLSALATAPDFEALTTNFHHLGYTNLMTPAVDMVNKLYTNLVLTSRMLRDNANTNLLVVASNRVAQARLLGDLAGNYANEAAWRFSGAGYSPEQFTNCLFALITQLEFIEVGVTNVPPGIEDDDAVTAAMDTLSDLMDELIGNYEAGAITYEAVLEASGDAYHARVQQNVQDPGDQLGNMYGPAFESLATNFAYMASLLLEARAAEAELDADALSAKAVAYETAADALVAQAAALNQTLETFTALADPGGVSLKSVTTGTNAGCDKDINTNHKFLINIGGLIIGTRYNDKIIAKSKTLLILGLGGDDLIIGNDKFNIIHSGSGDDEIHGQGGTDLLLGGIGNDCIFGDEGFDLLFGGDGNDNLHGGTNKDLIIGGKGDDKMYGDENFDVMIGGEGNDTIEGGDGINIMFGGPGDDTMTGGNGYQLTNNLPFLCNWIIGSLMFGGTNNDTMYGGDGIDVMFGGPGEDSMYSSNHIDVVFGNAGDDKIHGDDGGTLFYVDIDPVSTGFRLGNIIFGGTGADEITGGRDIDLLFGGDGDDTIRGSYTYPFWKSLKLSFDCGDVDIGMDDDLIFGGPDNDTLDGGYGTDFIFGGSGNDLLKGNGESFRLLIPEMGFLFGGSGSDTNQGGPWDTITLAFGNDGDDHVSGSTFGIMNLLFGNDGVDTIEGKGDLLNLIFGGKDDDTMTGGALVLDLMFGGAGKDTMHGGSFGALDVMFGGDGDDTMIGDGSLVELQFGNADNDNMNSGPCLLYAMWGNDSRDTMVGSALLGIMFGNDNADTLTGGFGIDIMFGGPGPDIMDGGDGPDVMFGNTGNDTMSGGNGPDLILGNSGDDTIYGGGGPDILLGNPGNDHIYGEGGPDLIFGGPDHDVIGGGDGSDLIFGGSGPDCILGGDGNDPISLNLIFGGADNDFIDGDAGINLLFGNSGSDTIRGGAGANFIFGNRDDDTIKSIGIADGVWGNGGNDKLQSYSTTAGLRGNSDADQFEILAGSNVRVFGGFGSDTYTNHVGSALMKVKSAIEASLNITVNISSCAEVHGVTWLDSNQNGIRDPGEPGIAGVMVYLNLKHPVFVNYPLPPHYEYVYNGIHDSDEPYTYSMADDTKTCEDETGMYWLTELPEGTNPVREVRPSGYHRVFPIQTHTVTLAGIDVVTNKDFGYAPGSGAVSIANVSFINQGGMPILVLRGSGGVPDTTFDVLTSTNIAAPRSDWTIVGTHLFDGGGSFSVTNALPTGDAQRFFLLNLP